MPCRSRRCTALRRPTAPKLCASWWKTALRRIRGSKADGRPCTKPRSVARNAMQVTPLHSAAAAHSAEIVRLLVENGAPANSRQQGGWTALHEAAQIGDREMVKTLIEYGADRSVRSDDGRTPAQMAQAKGHEEIARMLLP